MEFRKYDKIHRLGKDEVAGILDGDCYIQEKIDGANTSIWIDAGVIQCGSRNRHLIDDQFNGFVQYAKDSKPINDFFAKNPSSILYGEWLVKHTIAYKETCYRKFYLFDIYSDGGFLSPEDVEVIASEFGIDYIPVICKLKNPEIEELKEYVGKSAYGEKGEGIVIKNMEFINSFGDMCYAKLVSDTFKEKNLLAFNDNDKHAENYNEMYFVNKYMTLARVCKIMDKLQPEINERLDLKHIPRICNSSYHDMLTEEIWEASKKIDGINFKTLKNLAYKKSKMIYMDVLEDQINRAA